MDDEAYDKLLDLDNERTQEIAEKLVGYMYGLTDEQLENAAGEVGPKRLKSKGEQIFDLENRIEDLKIIAKKSIRVVLGGH